MKNNKILRGIAAILGLIIGLGVIGLFIFLFGKGWYDIITGNADERESAIWFVITLLLVVLGVLVLLSRIFPKNRILKKIKDELVDSIMWGHLPPHWPR